MLRKVSENLTYNPCRISSTSRAEEMIASVPVVTCDDDCETTSFDEICEQFHFHSFSDDADATSIVICLMPTDVRMCPHHSFTSRF
jgi:hypothetical protein